MEEAGGAPAVHPELGYEPWGQDELPRGGLPAPRNVDQVVFVSLSAEHVITETCRAAPLTCRGWRRWEGPRGGGLSPCVGTAWSDRAGAGHLPGQVACTGGGGLF